MHKTLLYSQFAKAVSRFSGAAAVFLLAVARGRGVGRDRRRSSTTATPGSSSINTGTTIVTFLMVFVIQNTQMRDTEAMQVKLDELIRATKGAHNALLDLEELEEDELEAFKRKYLSLARTARQNLDARRRRHRLAGA